MERSLRPTCLETASWLPIISRLFFPMKKIKAARNSLGQNPLPRLPSASETFSSSFHLLCRTECSVSGRDSTCAGLSDLLMFFSSFSVLSFKLVAFLMPVFVFFFGLLCVPSEVAANGARWLAVATWTRCFKAVLRPEGLTRKIKRTQPYEQASCLTAT